MPFSSTPVYVGAGDQVQIRYPTPSTWNTTTTIQVQIGTGLDPNGVILGTRLPDSQPAAFTFTDNSGSTIPTASLPGDFVNTFQKNTTYYSNTITVSGVELRVPINVSASGSGPLGSYPNLSTAAFSINGGTYITSSAAVVSFTGNTTSGSTSITNVSSTTGLAVGKYISSSAISGEILSISGTTVTVVNPASSTSTAASMQCLYTVTNSDVIRLRVTTENWYTTNTNVTLTISDNYWGAGNQVSDTWSITTRAQDQVIDTLPSGTFTDYVDLGPSDFSTYKTQNIAITGIDNDVLLRATATGNGQISKDGVTWSQSLTQLKLGDTLYTRLAVGSTYTTKTTGTFTVFAQGGDTATINSVTYTNNNAGTYGSGSYAVTQTLGTASDDWQIWTEVDRYPNAFSLSPIFTPTDTLPLATVTSGGAGYTNGNTYTTTGGSGSGLTVKVTASLTAPNDVASVTVVERGSGYNVDDVLTIQGGTPGSLAQVKIIQYRIINVSTTSTLNNAEIGFTYYANFTVGGLGTEYTTGTYSDLESPFVSRGSTTLPFTVPAAISGQTVQMGCIVSQGDALIRKNGAGTWVSQLVVQNNDVINVKVTSSTSFNTSKSSTITLQGPPSGNPTYGNPTAGPNPPTFSDQTASITIKTRNGRTDPYQFRVESVYNADPGIQYIKQIPIAGLDLTTDAAVTSQPAGANCQISLDGITYSTTIASVPASTPVIYIKATSPTTSGATSTITYRVGNTTDTFSITSKKTSYTYSTFSPTTSYYIFQVPQWADTFDFVLIGAGGGNGGDDAPNSFGGRGGSGNRVVGSMTLPDSLFADPNNKQIRVFSPTKGNNGTSFSKNSAGGTGGYGYATGGNGGATAASEYSGSGGGGGGAAAITLVDGTLLALAGGGAGGGGAGDDTVIQKPSQNGNNSGNGPNQTTLSGLNLTGLNGTSATTAGGGGGGSGGGFGVAGTTNTQLLDEFGGIIGTTDLDANGGGGGGSYYNPTYVTLSSTPSNLGANTNTDGFALIAYPPQDFTPDPFSFTPINDATPSTVYYSDYVQITGISGTITVSATSNGLAQSVRVCTGQGTGCGAWASSATIKNGQYLQLQMQTGGSYFTGYTMQVQIGDTTNIWVVTTGTPPDNTPTDFIIPSLTNQPISTAVDSSIVTISGINTPATIIATNGALISICNGTTCDSFAASPRTISNGQGFKLRITTSSNYSTTVTSDVVVGGSSPVTWSVATGVQPDNTPDGFTFFSLTNQNLNTTVYSNSATIQGISNSITFTVTGGATLVVNSVDLGISSTTVNLYDVVKLKYTTSGIVGDSKTFNVTAGTFTTTWVVTNAGVFGTSPTPFIFSTVTATAANTNTNSNTITIAGLGTTVGAYATNGAKLSKNGAAYNTYTSATPILVTNGDTLSVQLLSSGIAGFSVSTTVTVGSYSTTFTVITPAPTPDPILGQWYSSPNMVQTIAGTQYKYATKFDGLPIGSIMPVFKDSTETDSWGNLTGKADSKYPGWIYCDGSYISPTDYPALFAVIGNTYGANVGGNFRLPDLRNKKLMGTGPVDGNAASSPALIPDYGPAKDGTNKSNLVPGSHGGLWYIDTIAVTSAQSVPQVKTPGTGLTATESDYFSIGTLVTTGYEKVTGDVDFTTTGQVSGAVSLKSVKLYDVPSHQHYLLTGQADPAKSKGVIRWGGNGGKQGSVATGVTAGQSAQVKDAPAYVNMWGYALQDLTLDNTNTVPSAFSSTTNWLLSSTPWAPSPPYSGPPGLTGEYVPASGIRSTVTLLQPNIGSSGTNYNEINSYINLSTEPFGGTSAGGTGNDAIYKFVGAVDIPRKTISIGGFNPTTKNNHSHYLSLSAITATSTTFSYGNVDNQGTAYPGTPTNSSVTITYTADQLGLGVLPGKFTLNSNKQLIPTPSLSPQTKVPLITPYTWVKWLIKAY